MESEKDPVIQELVYRRVAKVVVESCVKVMKREKT